MIDDISQGYLDALGVEAMINDPADIAVARATNQQGRPGAPGGDREDEDQPGLTPRSVIHPEHGTIKGAMIEQGQRAADIAKGGYAHMLDATAHFWRVLDGAADSISKYTQTDKGGVFKRLSDSAEHWANHYHGKVRYKDFATNVTSGIVGSGPGIAMFAMGPIWAGLEGMTEDGIKGAVAGVARRWMAGRVFGALHKDPNMISRMTTGAAYFTAEAAAAGETDPGKLAEAATTGAAFTAKGKSPKYFKPTEGMKLETGEFFGELDRAVEAGEMDSVTAGVAKDFVKKNVGSGIDVDTSVKVLNEMKLASDEILLTEGIEPGTPAIVTGKATSFAEADQIKTMIEIYQGHDPTTVIEELFHRDFYKMSLAERRELQTEYDQTEGMGERPRSVDEWYAQGKTAEFFATAGKAQGPMAKLQEWFKDVVGKVKELAGNKADESLSGMKEPAGAYQVRKIAPRMPGDQRGDGGLQVPSDLTPLTERGKYASLNINVTKLDGADIPAVEKMLNELGEAHFANLREHQGGPISHEQMVKEGRAQAEALARQTNTPVKSILKGWEKDAEKMYQRATAARTIHLQAARELMDAAAAAKGVDASDRDLATYRVALGNFLEIHRAVTGITASYGRGLSSFAARVGADAMTSERMLTREFNAMLNEPGNDRGMIKDMAEKLTQLSDLDMPPDELLQMIDKTAKGFAKATTKDMILEAWINGLLSGPQTHAANTLSNTLVMATQVPERWLAVQIGRLHRGDKVAAGESGAMAYGLLAGIKDGFLAAGRAYKAGESSDIVGKIEAPHRAITARNMGLDETSVFGRGVDLLAEHVVRQPGKLLMTEDEFFKSVGYRMELHAQAYRMAKAEGLNGKAFAERVQEILDDPPEDVKIGAQDAARYVTFTNELGKSGQALQKWINSHGLLKMIAPFIRTPTNIFKYAFARTPIAPLLMKSVKDDIRAGGSRRDLAIARVALGSMAMGLVASQVGGSKITGGGPADGDERRIWLEENKPYSVKIGEKWHSYQRLEPLGSIIGIAADVSEIVLNRETMQDIDDALAVAAAAISRQITSKTFTRGFADFIHAMDDPVRYGETYAERLVGTVVPTGVAQLNKGLNDPYFREVNGILDAIKARTPWSETLMPKRGPWGEPIKTGGSLGPDWISPVWTGTAKDEPINKEMIDNHIGMPPLQRTIRIVNQPVRLTPEQWDRYQELAGNAYKDPRTGMGLKQALNQLVQTREYAMLSDGQDGGKAMIILNYIHNYRTGARAQLRQEYPEIDLLATEAAAAQRAAMMEQ